jgi:formate dehydrogenase major subunit/formate dehydrogenase-N alpha subunit
MVNRRDLVAISNAFARNFSTSVPDRTATILYALGWTHHSPGRQIIRAAAMLQLLLGNIGMAGVALTRCAVTPIFRAIPTLAAVDQSAGLYAAIGKTAGLSDLYCANHPPALGVNEVNYWQNTPKFFRQHDEKFLGRHATAENNWGYDWLPKWDRLYDVMTRPS